MNIESWSLERAQQVFDTLPPQQRIVSLSPAFAAADAVRDPLLEACFLGIEQAGRLWLNSIHLRPLPNSDGAFGAISPYGYGGPLCNTEDAAFVAAAWQAYSAWCRRHAVLAEFARFHPQAGNDRFYGGQVSHNRRTVSVDLTLDDLTSQYATLARRKLKRAAAAGAVARFSRDTADWRRYGAFYRAGMQGAGATAWYLFGDAYFESMAQVPQAWLCICERGGQWLSAGVYLFGEGVVEYHLGASSLEGHETGSATLMQHAAALWGQSQGAHSLYLGGGITAQPDNPLLFYKMSFSRRLLDFKIGQTLHDEQAYWAVAARNGFDRDHPPPRVLMD
ncbi:MAG: hypothetical protein HY854_23205 [Burkholderiales bacterium]|nr:hypothetical protein [Burkholderiales bacterium]